MYTNTSGSKTYELIHSFWKLPAVIIGVEILVWQNPLEKPHITKIWQNEGLLYNGMLTVSGEELVFNIKLLEYEMSMLAPEMGGGEKTTDPEKYKLLRDGLRKYCLSNISPMLTSISGFINTKESPQILDYCGGSGAYLHCLLDLYKDSKGTLVDKDPNIYLDLKCHSGFSGEVKADFKKDPNWYHSDGGDGKNDLDFTSKFDLVMLNEILHCCDKDDMEYLLSSTFEMLKPSGRILIVEQIKNPFLDWRLASYTKEGTALEVEFALDLVCENGFTVDNILHKDNHWFMTAFKTANWEK